MDRVKLREGLMVLLRASFETLATSEGQYFLLAILSFMSWGDMPEVRNQSDHPSFNSKGC